MEVDWSLAWANTFFADRDDLYVQISPSSSNTLVTPPSSNSAYRSWGLGDFDSSALDESSLEQMPSITIDSDNTCCDESNCCDESSSGLGLSIAWEPEVPAACRKREPDRFSAPASPSTEEVRHTKKKRSRGEHVKNRPDVQQTGRNGAADWAKKLQELRAEWELNRVGEQHAAFKAQLAMRQRMRTRARLECLLRKLQLCTIAGEIEPAAFSESEEESFLGWTGFCVYKERAPEFRHSIQSMFPKWGKMDDKTLNCILRDAGLVPTRSWPEAWAGLSCFVFQPSMRENKRKLERE
mmetsp:Transcript_14676/g.34811  ORF Transcript_14676/g.34811 Transcript_14676/m.34811 type:complete len:296 (+) Transcript_14676:80-967(+)